MPWAQHAHGISHSDSIRAVFGYNAHSTSSFRHILTALTGSAALLAAAFWPNEMIMIHFTTIRPYLQLSRLPGLSEIWCCYEYVFVFKCRGREPTTTRSFSRSYRKYIRISFPVVLPTFKWRSIGVSTGFPLAPILYLIL